MNLDTTRNRAGKREAPDTSADGMYKGAANGRQALCSFIRSRRICLAAATVAVLVVMGLFIMFFINNKEISQLTVTVNDLKRDLENMSQRDVDNEQNQTTAKESPLGITKMPASLSLQSVLEQLQADMQQLKVETGAKEQMSQAKMQQLLAKDQEMEAEMQQLQNEMAAKDQKYQAEMQQLQAEIQQLQAEMATKDVRIQHMEQRDYIERCENGTLVTPAGAFMSVFGDRQLDLTATFSSAFRTTPVVTVGWAVLDHFESDVDGNSNIRFRANVVSVSTTSLTVRIGTWSNSKLYGASIHWMACA
uniref:H-type lectin domain-containing protein n=1 Tax=Branchiostoma floridae TaxID=7739 RepID=C3XSX5_BRAFL|eukprot:XP_002612834.1 hypothetical protein BRAFLDRAFT_67218 [Branchiostoma floridae]